MARFSCFYLAVVVCLCVFLVPCCAVEISAEISNTAPQARTKADNVSIILSSLLEGYDKRIRPNYGGDPLPVNISMYVYSMGPVSEAQMQYTMDLYFRQLWTDERLKFPGDIVDELSLNSEMVDKLWVPDTYFVNEKSAKFHDVIYKNTLIRIRQNGDILYSTRLTVTASCPMNLAFFPMDQQRCSLKMESYAYSDKNVHYYWMPNSPINVDPAVTLPQFQFLGNSHRINLEVYYVGNYSQLIADFYLGREISYYLIQTYMPSTLIVIVSWVSFWIPRSSTPARTALGITTVLTMTTLMGNAGSSLPKLSYVKAIDIFLGMCYFFVFAALLEFALVSYYEKPRFKEARRKLKESREIGNHSTVSKSTGSPCSVYSVDKKHNEIEITFVNEDAVKSSSYSSSDMNRGAARRSSYIRAAERGSPQAKPMRRLPQRETHNNMSKCEEICGPSCASFGEIGIDPGAVDQRSRKAFPFVFLVLNIAYWGYYITVTSGGVDDLIAEVMNQS
ncbi:gamma-aminobutyric acid receptor subunit alpha-6-like [Asterias rubens]|uniref:gamma-aminobutyric acid receptor subunit alpha-6-like n=1 Tax=Asterias rubens TaxID=7604 RepID=UPI0014559EAA|nr:gamma-aminobutyric acid receptor subunit alpha-6-like [Asterias rubens]